MFVLPPPDGAEPAPGRAGALDPAAPVGSRTPSGPPLAMSSTYTNVTTVSSGSAQARQPCRSTNRRSRLRRRGGRDGRVGGRPYPGRGAYVVPARPVPVGSTLARSGPAGARSWTRSYGGANGSRAGAGRPCLASTPGPPRPRARLAPG